MSDEEKQAWKEYFHVEIFGTLLPKEEGGRRVLSANGQRKCRSASEALTILNVSQLVRVETQVKY